MRNINIIKYIIQSGAIREQKIKKKKKTINQTNQTTKNKKKIRVY